MREENGSDTSTTSGTSLPYPLPLQTLRLVHFMHIVCAESAACRFQDVLCDECPADFVFVAAFYCGEGDAVEEGRDLWVGVSL